MRDVDADLREAMLQEVQGWSEEPALDRQMVQLRALLLQNLIEQSTQTEDKRAEVMVKKGGGGGKRQDATPLFHSVQAQTKHNKPA